MSDVRPIALLTLALAALAGRADAGTLVNPGGIVRGLAADPIRAAFYASLDSRELVRIDIATASVTGRTALPGDPGAVTITPDGSRAFVALVDACDVAIVDLAAFTTGATIDLSATGNGPSGLVASATRLYAVCAEGASIVDVDTGIELWVGNRSFFSSDVALSPDGATLYVCRASIPTSLLVYDVCNDALVYAGENPRDIGQNGQAVEIAPDGRRLYVASGFPYHVRVLAGAGLLAPTGSVPTGAYPSAIAVSRDGSRLFLGHTVDREVLVADAATGLAFRAEPLQGDVEARGLALSADGKTLAAVISFGTLDPNRLELIDVRAPVANRGGVRLRPVDQVTGLPIPEALIDDPVFEGDSAWLDVQAAVLARAPIPPSTFTTDIKATGYSPATRTVTITAGAWTDLGDVALSPTSGPGGPYDVAVIPPLEAGKTSSATVYGRGFEPGATVTATTADVTIDSASFVDFSRIDVQVTIAAGSRTGGRSVRLDLPDGRNAIGSLVIRAPGCAPVARPPNRISVLYAAKAPPFDVRLEWDDSRVDALHDAADVYLVFRSVDRPNSGYTGLPEVANSGATREQTPDPGALADTPPNSRLHFYKVSARNADGDSGDLP